MATMATLASNHAAPLMPLNYRDCRALEEMFTGFDGDQLRQIETICNRFVAPLDPSEEIGWGICSSIAILVANPAVVL